MTTNEHGASAGDGSSGATRLLEVAARNADELLGEARAEVASITAAAHADAERVHTELEKTRAEQNDELDRHRATVMAELAERQAALEAEVARLEQLEQEIRARIRNYPTEHGLGTSGHGRQSAAQAADERAFDSAPISPKNVAGSRGQKPTFLREP